jgi:hypothetical protein
VRCAFGVVIVACGCGIVAVSTWPQSTQPSDPRSSELLANWVCPKLITLDLADVPLKDLLKEIERQSDVRMIVDRGNQSITLKLDGAPLWKAVAEASIAAKVPVSADFLEPGITFHDRFLDDLVYHRYQVIGPFHIGLFWSPDKWQIKEKPAPMIVVQPNALETEGRPYSRGIRNITLREPGSKPFALEKVIVQGGPGGMWRTYWPIPQELLDKKVDLRGEMECEVYVGLQDVTLSVQVGQSVSLEHFAGMKASVTNVDYSGEQGVVKYQIRWNHGLKGADAQKWNEIVQRNKAALQGEGEPPSDAEVDKWSEWVYTKAGQLRVLRVVKKKLLDREDKAITLGSFTEQSDIINGEISFKKGQEAKDLRLTVGDAKSVRAVIEFKNIFAN